MTPFIKLLATTLAMTFICASGITHAQTTPTAAAPPSHLRAVSPAADANLLGQMFGSVAYSAAGMVDIREVTNSINADGDVINRTDSALSAMMKIYNLSMVVAMGIALFVILVGAMAQAGITGEVLSKRYDGWSAFRAIYGVVSVLPLIGGWSLGQWGILSAAFFGSTIANNMNVEGNRWTYSSGVVKPIQMPQGPVGLITENMYLSELCAESVNRWYRNQAQADTDAIDYLNNKVNEVTYIIDTTTINGAAMLGAYTHAKERIERNRIIPADYEVKDTFTEWDDADENNVLTLWDKYNPSTTNDDRRKQHKTIGFSYDWGSEKSKVNSCGSASFSISIANSSGATGQGPRSKQMARTYTDAQKNALKAVQVDAQQTIAKASERLKQLEERSAQLINDAPLMTLDRGKIFDEIQAMLAADPLEFRALVPLLDHTLELPASQTIYDEFFATKKQVYYSGLLAGYNTARDETTAIFDEILQRLHDRQIADQAIGFLGAGIYNNQGDLEGNAAIIDGVSQSMEDEDDKFEDLYHPLIVNSQKGWMYAGFKWHELGRGTELQYVLQKTMPTFTPYHTQTSAFPTEIANQLNKTDLMINSFGDFRTAVEEIQRNPDPLNAGIAYKMATEHDDDLRGYFEEFQSYIGELIMDQLGNGLGSGDNRIGGLFEFNKRDMLRDLQDTGHAMLILSETLWLMSLTVEDESFVKKTLREAKEYGQIGLATVSTGPAGGIAAAAKKKAMGMVRKLGPMIGTLALVFFAVGVMLSVYLPMLPAIMWCFALSDWVRKIVEALLAQPIWHAAHLIPGDESLINGASRNGYVIIVALAITPPVMLMSLYFAQIALSSFGFLMQDMLDSFLPSMHKGFISGLVIPLASLAVFTSFLLAFTHRILAWIYEIHDHLPSYFGGSTVGYGTGQSAGKFADGFVAFQSKTQVMAGSLGGPGAGTPNSKPAGGQKNPNLK